MAPDMWLVSVMAGLLTAALSGPLTPAQPSDANSSLTLSWPQDEGGGTPASSLMPGPRLGVRLVNGSDRCSGTVEVWRASAWRPACGASWNRSAAEAVCRVLGCGGSRSPKPPPPPPSGLAAGNASVAPNATRGALAPAVRCSGEEWRLCEVVEQPCGGDGSPAQVTCTETRALRLVAGGSPCAGRVEMLEHGQWGSVCDDTWDLEDGHVACGQLGCGWAVQVLPGLHFPPGQGPIHRDQVNCSGAESFLWDCPGLHGRGYCGHKEDAGVVCSEHQSWRLTRAADPCEGQVEVYFRGMWNTVCDSEWYEPEATVLCRSLGCGTAAGLPRGWPHSLPGQMYYSCKGSEAALHHCTWRYNNSNLCSQSRAARVLCSGARRLLNLSTSEGLTSAQPVTKESSVTVMTSKAWDSGELRLLLPCIVLGTLLLCALVTIAALLLRGKGKYAFPDMVNHQHPPASTQAGVNSYSDVPNTNPKEEVPLLPVQVPAPPSDSGSDSDYEHYDFSTQPPVALSTFYNSQRHRVTEEQVRQNRFQMPPVEEGESQTGAPPTPTASLTLPPCLCPADTPSLGPQRPARGGSSSSTSSGEGYCNSPHGPHGRRPPWTPSTDRNPLPEQPPSLELAGSQGTFSAGPSADDSSSTSSGEWYQNFKPPPLPPGEEQFAYPGSATPQPGSTDNEDYDDIGAA
ncbi:LOW QUALITY PROTEIN: T-cell differentiation antigen CD6 [Sorex araneus]|uniref:LOW QUALITY PROTEIN: T-cell differentiation antigen CD6 n=1 Tax=Sorex araneus TaxID=42254 RepID=UPI00243345D3|nr:LOW QUALITY PROTEIN: T-cell differentiation antigen CD6 [Sorex araneus]